MNRMTAGPIISTVLAVLSLSAASAAADTVQRLEPSTEPIHVRVLFESDPAHEAVVAWTTTAEGADHRVHVDTEPREGELDAYARNLPSIHSQPYTLRDDEADAGMAAWTHNVLLADLEPATRYYLTVASDGQRSREYYFITAPDDDRDIELLLVGDSRVGATRTSPDNNRRRVNALMRDLLEDRPNIVAMGHGADYTNRAHWAQLYWWLKDHAEMTTTQDGRLLPIIPARGNHDLDVGFEEMFWWPDRENDYYYATQLSAQVAFITLNTEISRGGDQRDWLEAQLAELRPRSRWLIGQWHRPAWPSVRAVSSGAAQREAWVPLFERYGLDLGYEAHDHSLKRTYPIYQGDIDPQRGVLYIGDGGGGVPQRQPDPSRWFLEVTDRHHHAHILRFTDDRLEGAALNHDGEIVDQFTLIHDRRNVADDAELVDVVD
ncbi:MAG: metallophosphoesterase family protein [Phycisphaeraceae bacterium]